ncbi:MAG: YhdH/YhfP family quinone oxidoreductase, partial [Flavobacteriales bacterium]|nr:YhdH/YhfP family quinone oxidoreductase [Flavobacteriales bacterium]
RALITSEENKTFTNSIEKRDISDLPENDTLIKVKYSSLNYKDALSASGNKGVTRNYPHTPGIDAAGIVEKTSGNKFKSGDEVIVTGYDMGMNTFGGFGEYIKVPQEWIVKKPENLSLSESMAFGTAGLTAGLCLRKLLAHGLKPDDGDVFVSGVTGGVGIISLMLFKKLGFNVTAITGKLDQEEFLKNLGANQVIDRNTLDLDLISPLQKPIYSGGIDAVGGKILSNLICSTSQRAAIACCGMVGGLSLDTSIFPFILRGLTLFGIDSAESLIDVKHEIWNNFSSSWKLKNIDENIKDISLDELPNEIDKILKGNQIGRVRVVYD